MSVLDFFSFLFFVFYVISQSSINCVRHYQCLCLLKFCWTRDRNLFFGMHNKCDMYLCSWCKRTNIYGVLQRAHANFAFSFRSQVCLILAVPLTLSIAHGVYFTKLGPKYTFLCSIFHSHFNFLFLSLSFFHLLFLMRVQTMFFLPLSCLILIFPMQNKRYRLIMEELCAISWQILCILARISKQKRLTFCTHFKWKNAFSFSAAIVCSIIKDEKKANISWSASFQCGERIQNETC